MTARWLALLAVPLGFHGAEGTVANPVRRVVTLLQHMQEKVTAEGKKEQELFEKFMCYCKTGAGDLQASIAAAQEQTTQSTAALAEAEAQVSQLKQDLVEHEAGRADAKQAMAEATALREKEAATFAKESSDLRTNIDALAKAIAALEKGMGGSFLQASTSSVLKRLTIEMDISNADRDMLTSFLSQGQGARYAPASGEITGILKQMKDTMEKDLADLTGTEQKAIQDYEAMAAAKHTEIEMNTQAIEDKTARLGRTEVEIVDLRESLDDAATTIADDQAFLRDLSKNCATKEAEWEVRQRTRSEELLALSETIKILNDDDALELFKKTLPSPSLLEMKVTSKAVRQQALQVLKAGNKKDPRVELVMLALTGHAANFDNVIHMIDEMVALLGKEQTTDDERKAYCEAELDKTDDDLKGLEQSVADLEKAIATAKDTIVTLTAELAALAAGITALDKAVSEATETRQAENAEYKDSMASDKAAKELLLIAQNRLNQFYNPALYRPPPKMELSSEQRIAVNSGSEAQPTVAPSGIAGTGVTVFVQVSANSNVAPPPPPETWNAYTKKGEEHAGVTEMMNLLIADIDKHMQESQVDETDAQKAYEEFMEDSRNKRAADSKSIADKEGVKANLESELLNMEGELQSTQHQAMATGETLRDLHLECDWLINNYEARKEARVGEVDSLKKARSILSGADYE